MNNPGTAPTDYIEVSVTVERSLVEAVSDFIIENFCSGLVLEDEEDSPYTTILFYMPEDDTRDYHERTRAFLSRFSDDPAGYTPRISSRTVSNVDWEEQYRNSVEPILIEPDILVRAPWHDASAGAKYEILVEPKMAFGTGRHETTRSCLKVIAERFESGERFLDVGCGSGILSILADKMGASFIMAIDYDIMAVDNCRQNFGLNNVRAPFEVLFGSIEKCHGDPPFDFVCANIIKLTVIEMLPDLNSLTRVGGLLVLSGLLQQDEEEIAVRLDEHKLARHSIVRDNEWLTFVVEKD